VKDEVFPDTAEALASLAASWSGGQMPKQTTATCLNKRFTNQFITIAHYTDFANIFLPIEEYLRLKTK
jgi:hypothetical protein